MRLDLQHTVMLEVQLKTALSSEEVFLSTLPSKAYTRNRKGLIQIALCNTNAGRFVECNFD